MSRDVSRDVQVRVVFCDWLAWLLRMKRSGHEVSLKSLLDKRHHSTEDVALTCDTNMPFIINKVFTAELCDYGTHVHVGQAIIIIMSLFAQGSNNNSIKN